MNHVQVQHGSVLDTHQSQSELIVYPHIPAVVPLE